MSAFWTGKGKAGFMGDYRLKFSALPFFYLWLILILPLPARAETSPPLPAITRLDSGDTMFRQYISDVEAARRLVFSPRFDQTNQAAVEALASSLTVYSYTPADRDELLGIAARCSIPYATLASLNRFSHAEDIMAGKAMLLPSVPGIFIPETPQSDLERLIFSAREGGALVLTIRTEDAAERYRFIPGDDFNPTERIFFLNRGFHFPLRHFQVSSPFGFRVNPVTGKAGIHGGMDLAAPYGSEVYAVQSGTVAALGEDPVLGNYVIISHENSLASLYGHLSSIDTSLHAELQSGSLIGKVGSTGQSTGPHLHFEIRQNGQSRDPARLLGLFKR